MFGPAFLVAPVTSLGETSRQVYLPAGADWYDYWTNRKYTGGQTIAAAAPVDQIPLFVRAGSIVPVGEQVPSTMTPQKLDKVLVYPGRDAAFTLYDDDGESNSYRKTGGRTATLRWDDAAGKLTASGTLPTGQDAGALVQVVAAQSGSGS
jgi:alpha-D-xyloside xylohydrolase